MILTVEEIVKTLRNAVNVQYEESEVIDPAYLAMTDEDLMLFIKLAVSRAYPSVTTLSDLPEGSEYPIVLLAKIELYTKLAVLKADKVDMGADNNNYLKQDQRFQHYMKLVQSAKDQYENWLENEGQGEVSSYDVLLDNRHYSNRNYEKQVTPKVQVSVDSVTSDSVDFHWKVSHTSHFGRFKVYISETPIVDMFRDGVTYSAKLTGGENLILSTDNIRNTAKRVNGLTPNTTYYIAVISIERNQVWGYSEVSFDTLPVLEDEENFETDTLPPTDSEV